MNKINPNRLVKSSTAWFKPIEICRIVWDKVNKYDRRVYTLIKLKNGSYFQFNFEDPNYGNDTQFLRVVADPTNWLSDNLLEPSQTEKINPHHVAKFSTIWFTPVLIKSIMWGCQKNFPDDAFTEVTLKDDFAFRFRFVEPKYQKDIELLRFVGDPDNWTEPNATV
jgi:hypothetical protein